jgi:hypothetical protein
MTRGYCVSRVKYDIEDNDIHVLLDVISFDIVIQELVLLIYKSRTLFNAHQTLRPSLLLTLTNE